MTLLTYLLTNIVEIAKIIWAILIELTQHFRFYYKRFNGFISFQLLVVLFMLMLTLGIFLAYLIVSKNSQGGEVLALVPLKDHLIGSLVASPWFQGLARAYWGELALGHSSENLLALLAVTILVLTAFLVLACYQPLYKLPLGGLLLIFIYIFYRLVILAYAGLDAEQLPLVKPFAVAPVAYEGLWHVIPSWGIAVHPNGGPGFAGLGSPEQLKAFVECTYNDVVHHLHEKAGLARPAYKLADEATIERLVKLIQEQGLYSRTDVLQLIADELQKLGYLDFTKADYGAVALASFVSIATVFAGVGGIHYLLAVYPQLWYEVVGGVTAFLALGWRAAMSRVETRLKDFQRASPVREFLALAGSLEQTGWSDLWAAQLEYLLFGFFCALFFYALGLTLSGLGGRLVGGALFFLRALRSFCFRCWRYWREGRLVATLSGLQGRLVGGALVLLGALRSFCFRCWRYWREGPRGPRVP
jgi:hypothetical protein